MPSKYEPWSFGSVHALEMLCEIGVLGRGGGEVVLSTHHDDVDAAKVKPIPD